MNSSSPEDPQPRRRPPRRIGGQERRLGVPLLEVLVDHGRLRQHPAVLLEHRNPPDRVQLVEPGRAVLEVDHDRLVREPFSASAMRTRAQYGQRGASTSFSISGRS